MSMRTKVLGMVDVIMRVPPLFVIDEILKISMGLPTASNIIDAAAGLSPDDLGSMNSAGSMGSVFMDAINATDQHLTDLNPNADASEFYKVLSWTTLKIVTCLIGEWWTLNCYTVNNIKCLCTLLEFFVFSS